jgi:CII-binding regulator of phage lambda lysogenization HflD
MNWIDSVVGFVFGGAGSATVIHILNKRKNSAEADNVILINAKEIIAEWKEMRETYKKEIEENRIEIQRLRELVRQNQIDCDETNTRLILRIKALEEEIEKDKTMIKELTKRLKIHEKHESN